MGITYTCEYISSPRHVRVVSLGCTSAADTTVAIASVAELLKTQRECPVLADARLWRYHPSYQDVKLFSEGMAAMGVFDGPFALVVSDDLQFGIASQLGAMCARHGIHLAAFKTVEDGAHWLGLDVLPIRRSG